MAISPTIPILFLRVCIQLALSMSLPPSAARHGAGAATGKCGVRNTAVAVTITKTASGYQATLNGTNYTAKPKLVRVSCTHTKTGLKITEKVRKPRGKLSRAIGPILGVGFASKSNSPRQAQDRARRSLDRVPYHQPQVDERRIGRGVFLATVAGGLSALWWGKAAWGGVSSALGPVESAIPLVPSDGWRIYTVAASMPVFDPATWRLKIGGLVEQPQELSYKDLLGLPSEAQTSDFHCVTGWSVNGVRWQGVRFKDLLAAAKPLPGAHVLEFVSAEQPYVDYLTLKQAMLPDAMLAWGMDGNPLPQEHGAPVRVVIPEMYGYKNVKWVAEINLRRKVDWPGYWEQHGYDNDAWVGRSNGYGA